MHLHVASIPTILVTVDGIDTATIINPSITPLTPPIHPPLLTIACSHMLAALHLHVASVLGPEIPKGEAVASRDCVRVAWEGRVVEVEVVPGAGEEGERSAGE